LALPLRANCGERGEGCTRLLRGKNATGWGMKGLREN
jgi:hypothetical protein